MELDGAGSPIFTFITCAGYLLLLHDECLVMIDVRLLRSQKSQSDYCLDLRLHTKCRVREGKYNTMWCSVVGMK